MSSMTYYYPAMLMAFSFLSRAALASDSVWLPSVVDQGGPNGMCANDWRFGNTRIVQCAAGTPTTTQIAFNTLGVPEQQNEASIPAPKSWISVQDHSISLVPKNGSARKMWGAPNAGRASTNWGSGGGGGMMAQGHTTFHGDKQGDSSIGSDAVRSSLEYGYISYSPIDTCTDAIGEKQASMADDKLESDEGLTKEEVDAVKKDCSGKGSMSLGYNQFFISGGGGANYYLNGCPNYKPGQTSANMQYECPKVPMVPGSFKFSILGFLFGSMINSGHTSSFPNFSPLSDTTNYRDLSDYKSLVLTTTLDISNVGATEAARSAWVEFEDGSEVNFTDISSTTNLAGSKFHFISPGSGEDEIVMSFTQYYSAGQYTRDLQAFNDEFPGDDMWCMSDDGSMESCMRDLTGFNESPDSFPFGANSMVKKMGKGGLDALPKNLCPNGADNSACDLSAYTGATEKPASTKEQLASMAGAPKLAVTEVRPVKIYMRKHGGCTGRPASPAGEPDNSGMKGTTWPNAPADCPYWMTASERDSWTNSEHWWVTGSPSQSPQANQAIDCEAGDLRCYLIDIHLDLEDENGARTVLGNPENDAGSDKYGWGKGTFFMYDPEISTGTRTFEARSEDESDAGSASSRLVIAKTLSMFITGIFGLLLM